MELTIHQILLGFLLTLLAGLSTGIGSAIAFSMKRTSHRMLSISLGFSAGFMIYLSLVEVLGESRALLEGAHGKPAGYWYAVIAFFGGVAIIALIDRLVPEYENPHEMMSPDDEPEQGSVQHVDLATANRGRLMRTGLFTALAISIHNFPEGLATFIGTLHSPILGASITIAIAIHNIPEGIAITVPIWHATGSRRKAFRYSFLSGLSEPVGAIVGYLLLRPFFNDTLFGIVFAAVAGIMVYISFDELLPTAEKYGEHHLAIYGLIGGMGIGAVSLLLLA